MPTVYFAPDQMCTTLKLELKRVHDFFVANGWSVVSKAEGADRVVCGVCVGWDSLENASLQTLKDHECYGEKVVALGCVSGMDQQRMHDVHTGAVVPSFQVSKAEELIPDAKVRLQDVPEPSTFRSPEDYRRYDLSKRFVNVALGCAFSCAYCLHKVGIGPRRSRTVEHIVDQVKGLVGEGVRTVVLTGLETGLYGREIGTDFVTMLRAVLSVSEDFAVHIAQFHPSGILHHERELVELLGNSRVSDLQIPIQSTSDRMLSLMSRPPLPRGLGDILKEVAKANPRLVLRTDLLIGYPGESYGEFVDSVEFATMHFDEISVYSFEAKRGLPAKELENVVPADEVDRRRIYALKVISERGKLGHCGSQSKLELAGLERLREAQRNAKARIG